MMYMPPHFNPNPRPPTEEDIEQFKQEQQRELNTPLPMFYIVALIIIVLFVIMCFLGVDVFHSW
jgi:predicted nucleic acid-binding Zn ribbon protein